MTLELIMFILLTKEYMVNGVKVYVNKFCRSARKPMGFPTQ